MVDTCPPEGTVEFAPDITCIIVPDVIGLEAERALTLLSEAGLDATFTEPPLAGSVVATQNPPSGASVTPGSVVELEMLPVLNPPDLVIVPDVRNDTLAEARIKVQSDLVVVATGSEQDIVIDQNPNPGEIVKRGSNLELKLVPAPIEVVVPEFRGRTRQDAIALAEGVPLVLVGGDGPDSDVVKTQDPEPGREVDAGSSVRVTFGPVEPSQPTTVTGGTNPAASSVVDTSLGAGSSAATGTTVAVAETVPGLVGLSYDAAGQRCTATGFVLRVVGALQNGVVDTQKPEEGAAAAADRTIEVTLVALVPDAASWNWLIVTAIVVGIVGIAAAGVWVARRFRRPGSSPFPVTTPFHLQPARGSSTVHTYPMDADAPSYVVEVVARRNTGITTTQEHL